MSQVRFESFARQLVTGFLVVLVLILMAVNGHVAVGQDSTLGNASTPAQDSIEDEKAIELSGLSTSDSWEVDDFQPLDPSGTTFRKLLYRIGQVSNKSLKQWQHYSAEIDAAGLAADTRRARFRVFNRSGKATRVYRFDFSKEDAKDFLKGFFVVICEDENGAPFAIVSRSSIVGWSRMPKLESPQPIQFQGFFYGYVESGVDGDQRTILKIEKRKTGFANGKPAEGEDRSVTSSNSMPVFIAKRFSWFPEQADSTLKVDASKIALARCGVDIGLLDIVRSKSGKPIGASEADCFWQMLAGCQKLDPENPKIKNRISFASMLGDPLDSIGQAATVQGRVRQCVPVKATDPNVVSLLNTDTYYQLTVFPDLDGRPIHVSGKDGTVEVYKQAFPVTACLTTLPSEFNAESIVGETFKFDGFFYRMWVYPSERTDASSLDGQPSPLVMVSQSTLVKSTSDQLGIFVTCLVFAMLLAIVCVSWFVLRSKSKSPSLDLPDRIELPNERTS